MTEHRFGMPTMIELADLAANVAVCRRLGLSFVELHMDLPVYQPESLPADVLKRYRDERGIGFTIHLPEQLNLAAFQTDIRRGQVDCVKNIIAWAGDAGIRTLTLHMTGGVYFTLPDGKVWLHDKFRDVYLTNLLDSMDGIIPALDANDVTLLIENTGSFGRIFLQDAMEQLFERYCRRIGLTWDVGHDAGSGYKDQPFLSRHIGRVAHMHLHDYDGRSDHQPLFSGAVDIPAMLEIAETNRATVVIETKTVEALTSSVEALQERGIM